MDGAEGRRRCRRAVATTGDDGEGTTAGGRDASCGDPPLLTRTTTTATTPITTAARGIHARELTRTGFWDPSAMDGPGCGVASNGSLAGQSSAARAKPPPPAH